MTRSTDISPDATTIRKSIPLPPVPWTKIRQTAPVAVPVGARNADDPLPQADIVILTWTSAEWSALDQVFMGRQTERSAEDSEWRKDWLPYTRGARGYAADAKSG